MTSEKPTTGISKDSSDAKRESMGLSLDSNRRTNRSSEENIRAFIEWEQSTAEALRPVAEAFRPFLEQAQRFGEASRPFVEELQRINEACRPIVEHLFPHKKIFRPIAESRYKDGAEALPEVFMKIVLISHVWPINDSELISYLVKNNGSSDEFDERVLQFYRKNNWRQLRRVIDRWNQFEAINDRLPILRDCFETLNLITRTEIDINAANVIVPTLVCQLEGVIGDYDEKIKNIYRNKTKNAITPFEILDENYGLFPFIVGTVFMASSDFIKAKEKGENLINIHRNKINHGDKDLLDYGTEENTIRLFLYIDAAIDFLVGERLRK